MISLKKLQIRQGKFNIPSLCTRQEGSISIFLALTLILILTFLFSLLETARISGLQECAERRLGLEMESLFGAYNKELWEHYGLLFLDMSYGSGEPDVRLLESSLMEEDYAEGAEAHFYRLGLKDAKVEGFILATDREGAEFVRQACEAAKEGFSLQEAETLENRIAVCQELEEQSAGLEQKWEEALDAEKEALDAEEEAAGIPELSGEPLPENPMAYVTQLKSSALLALVLEEPSELSGKGIDISTSVNNRNLFCGNMTVDSGGGVDKLWLVQYLNQYFSCKADVEKQNHVLDYELEYCIAGKDTDAENLEAVVSRLLLLREGANFVTIMQDAKKQSLAMELAVAAVGFTGIYPLIKAVQTGILLAWSYVESILDLRCLLSGGKVPLIKESSQWKSDLFHIQDAVSPNFSTGDEEGMSYREYLQVLLSITGQKELTCRAIDVIEKNIRLFSGNDSLRMDAMVSAVQVNAVYSAEPLFLNVIPTGRKIDGSYLFWKTRRIAY